MPERRINGSILTAARRIRSRSVRAIALVIVLFPALASAHARLVKSDPARRAALKTAPAAVKLWLNEAIEEKFSKVTVSDTGGKAVETKAARVDAKDPKLLFVELPPLDPGTYTVTFEVLSVDGHRVKQSFPFTIKDGAKPVTTAD